MNTDNKYKEYIQSKEWKDLRAYLIERRGLKCEICNKKTFRLQLHHITYERLFNEMNEDLILLCGICHQKEHGLFKPKKKYRRRNRHKPKKRFKGFTVNNRRDVKLQKRYNKINT